MVQKKSDKKTNQKEKVTETKAEAKKNEVTQPTKTEEVRTVNNQVVSFILFVVALVIYFFVGNMFMKLAVRENFCHIRYLGATKPTGAIVAVVDGENVYMSEIKDYVASIPQLSGLPMELIYPQLLETVVDTRVLKTAAEKTGMEDKPEVQRALQMNRDQILADIYLWEKLNARVTDTRLQALYEEEIANFRPETESHIQHILVKTEREAKDVIIRLKAGAPFELVAEKYSLDKSAPDGDLGYLTDDKLPPEFARAIRNLRKGQISEPIKTEGGWHVVVVNDRRDTEPPAFEEVKDYLKQILMEQDKSAVLAAERKALKVRILKPKW